MYFRSTRASLQHCLIFNGNSNAGTGSTWSFASDCFHFPHHIPRSRTIIISRRKGLLLFKNNQSETKVLKVKITPILHPNVPIDIERPCLHLISLGKDFQSPNPLK